MKSNFRNKIIGLSAIVYAVFLAFQFLAPQEFLNKELLYIPAFFIIQVLINHAILAKTMDKKASHFIRSFMVTAGIKLFVNAIAVVVVMWLDRTTVKSFAISFLLCYMIFTAFEIAELIGMIDKERQEKKS